MCFIYVDHSSNFTFMYSSMYLTLNLVDLTVIGMKTTSVAPASVNTAVCNSTFPIIYVVIGTIQLNVLFHTIIGLRNNCVS